MICATKINSSLKDNNFLLLMKYPNDKDIKKHFDINSLFRNKLKVNYRVLVERNNLLKG